MLHALPPKTGSAGQWQGMCFSATIPPKMQHVLSHVLSKDHISISTLDASEAPTLAKVPQYSVVIPGIGSTFTALDCLIKEEIQATKGESKIIVFGTTANMVALYAEIFEKQTNLKVYELQSRMSQPARTKATDSFKATQNGVLFATDGRRVHHPPSLTPYTNSAKVVGRGMDFPDVSLVLQVGLPADADAYTHRVGRTARAGKDGRAIILLTQLESYFLKVNRQFPIKPYPASDKVLNNLDAADRMSKALQSIDPKIKQKAYSAYLGFMKGFMNKMQTNAAELVQLANKFALEGMQCDQVPEMEKKTIGKMGLKGVPGIRYAKPTQVGQAAIREGCPSTKIPTGVEAPSRRLRHQGIPDAMPTLGVVGQFENQAWRGHQAQRGQTSNTDGPGMRGGNQPSGGRPGMRGGRGHGRGGHPGNVAKEKRRKERDATL